MYCLQSFFFFFTCLLAKEVAVAVEVEALHHCGGKEHVVYNTSPPVRLRCKVPKMSSLMPLYIRNSKFINTDRDILHIFCV